ncbi:hypothetical protein MMIC_P0907 [Mariprofundus micogutta]|uniref:Uncharacterized protein n=1 Tax=Mariprofundus micogutta TaxID=1921010 RepID=A0A1L8CM15_9PROT|nr:hypothetical protein [Mariprofundus micogutta]GAV19946.1 hypothetical protein MMIC_P0907 [Mariprofundus micogutta]
MISPDYFSFRWSWYSPVLNRQEQPAERCAIEVRRLPIRVSGRDAGEYIPYAVHPEIKKTISASLHRLQDYAIRYMVRGEKVSAHSLPGMDERMRSMVAHLRKQNPHLSRDMLHHWCADPKGATALLKVCEVLWEQGWKQDQMDAAPWVPAVNVLLLKMIRHGIASLSSEESGTSNHVMLCVVGGLYVWALQAFLKRYLEGVVEVSRIASYESMMLPVTPMVFLHHQPESNLLSDDSRLIRYYGLEPEIVPQLRYLRGKVGFKNEGGMLALLGKDKLGEHLLRRSWARLSLWKLAMKSGHGAWMRWVLDAKLLDKLLAGQMQPDAASMENLKTHVDEPVAAWLLAHLSGGRAAKNAGEPWLRDNITLLAFRVFDEDVRVEIARREAEKSWIDKAVHSAPARSSIQGGSSTARGVGGLRSTANVQLAHDLEQAWQDGELVLIQPDAGKALHSGKALSLRHGCMRIEWSEFLAGMHAISGPSAAEFLDKKFLPNLLSVVNANESIFLDECSASGCLLRGSVLALTETGVLLRKSLHHLYDELCEQRALDADTLVYPPLSICMDMTGEWIFSEQQHARLGSQRIAFSLAVTQVDAGVCRDSNVERLMKTCVGKYGLKPIGGVNVEPVPGNDGVKVQLLHNTGFAMTSSAMKELTSVLSSRAEIRELRPDHRDLASILDEYQFPAGGLDLLVIQRHGEKEQEPWVLMKAGKPCLAGVDVDLFELLDEDAAATRQIVDHGLAHWV